MKFLARLAAGNIALWITFWLIGMPLAIVWDLSGGCMLIECGVGAPWFAGFLVAVFSLACIAVVFVSFAIWRSSTNYPRDAWWKWPLAIVAKLCAVFSALSATISFVVVMYLLFEFVYAEFLD
jgi:hypothetical protein